MTTPVYSPGRIDYGGDYYPEQWTPDMWDEDVRLMRECGVTVVRVGIFAWAQVEPRPGAFEFDWVDEVMDRLADAGIDVCLATMTASPPPWMAHHHPETLPVREDGVVLYPGGRQHYCPSSPVYRRYATRLVERVAERYGGHRALRLWHVGNEYGVHVALSYSDAAAEGFRGWLRERYGTIDALNDAWSTTFWSQRYDDWAEVQPPRINPAFANPAQQIDFHRYSSDAMLECYLAELAILRRVTPDIPVTTNLLSVWKPVDFYRWAPHLDVVSHDSYPDPLDAEAHIRAAFGYDVMRSLRGGQPWLLMEQAPSAVSWRDRNPPKRPGQMRLWSYQALARGADAVMFFQWRQSRGGAEKFHSAMVPHAGTGTRVHREIRDLGRELGELAEIAGSRGRADVAIVMSWPSWWALELDSHPSQELRLLDRIHDHYRPLWEAGVTCDVVPPDAELGGYRLVVVPNLYMVSEDDAARLTATVGAGAHTLISFFSGIVDEADRVHLGGYPAPWRELLGLSVEEFWPLEERIDVAWEDGGVFAADTWAEDVRLAGAQAVAHFAAGDLAGKPAVTRHRYGTGVATYLATRPEPMAMAAIVAGALSAAGVHPVVTDLPAGVEATRREAHGRRYLFLLNHGEKPVEVRLAEPMHDLVGTGDTPSDLVALDGFGVAVLRAPS
jgi:beta-galactosidase